MAGLIQDYELKCILRTYRTAHKLTQRDVARITGIPLKTIGRLDRNDEKKPGLDVALLLASRLGEPLEALFEFTDFRTENDHIKKYAERTHVGLAM